MRRIVLAVTAVVLILGLWIALASLVRAGVDLSPGPDHPPPKPDAISITVEAVYGGTAAQIAHLMEAASTAFALTGRHDPRAPRKIRVAIMVVVIPGASQCVSRRGLPYLALPSGQLVVVTWLVREGPPGDWLDGEARVLGSVAQPRCLAPDADAWGELAAHAVPTGVAGVLQLIDGAPQVPVPTPAVKGRDA